jgi:hypothetical protein
MIYALTEQAVSDSERKAIAQAIGRMNQAIEDGNQDVIKKYMKEIKDYADKGTIIHVKDAHNAHDLYCIFCYHAIFPTNRRAPSGLTAQNDWHFEHEKNKNISDDENAPGSCIGEDSVKLGIKNPANHGCYIAIDCHRKCKTIVKRQTYCHLAEEYHCTSQPNRHV